MRKVRKRSAATLVVLLLDRSRLKSCDDTQCVLTVESATDESDGACCCCCCCGGFGCFFSGILRFFVGGTKSSASDSSATTLMLLLLCCTASRRVFPSKVCPRLVGGGGTPLPTSSVAMAGASDVNALRRKRASSSDPPCDVPFVRMPLSCCSGDVFMLRVVGTIAVDTGIAGGGASMLCHRMREKRFSLFVMVGDTPVPPVLLLLLAAAA